MQSKEFAYIYTIGCQMNIYDSEKLLAILTSCGYEQTDEMEMADIIVCNTCSIRHKAEEKAFSFLGRSAGIKKKKPHLITVMAGCVAQQEKENAFNRVPHLDIVLGTRAFSRFARHLDAIKSGQKRVVDTEDSLGIFEAMPEPSGKTENKISRFVTIMQGCDNYCTYCVVPYVRGRERSRPPENIVEEITLLSGSGVKEITLLGQNVNSYGLKEEQISFPELLGKVNEIDGIERIRFATSHPKDLSMELIHAVRDLGKVCNHLHLPVQSGANHILKKMNRGYTRETYLSKIASLKKACPGIALSTDIIVGFPTETPQDFKDTMDLLKEIRFDSIFAFAYSDRSSAPAASFKGGIDEKEKKERLNQLLEFQEQVTREKNQALIGKHLDVLVEGKSGKTRDGFENLKGNPVQMTGRSDTNKIVHFPSERVNIGSVAKTGGIAGIGSVVRVGSVVRIRIENAYSHSLWGYPELEEK